MLPWIIGWTVVVIAALIVEVCTTQMVSIWFCGSGLIALILACCSVPWWIQLVVFAITSVLFLLLFNFVIKKYLKKRKVPTNSDSLIGTEILITKDVSLHTMGEGQVRDVVWSVVVNDEVTISRGEYALIKEIRGNKLVVEKKKGN